MLKFARNISITFICLILGTMLSWQYRSINNNRVDTAYSERLDVLREELIVEKRNSYNLRVRNEEIEKQVSEYLSLISESEVREKSILREIERAQIIAGLIDVKGDGVFITFNYQSGRLRNPETDFLRLINELRASEAQAISINGERVLAMTEIKCLDPEGNQSKWMINGREFSPPFTIQAIADPEKLDESLNMIGGIVQVLRSSGYHITIEKKEDILIPKVRDDGSVLKYDLLKIDD
ncbi:UNVERIFIED_CONTAM: uncharacterized protein YlxW (UPF0749 family) [Acetivibrio alkalicellulosi]